MLKRTVLLGLIAFVLGACHHRADSDEPLGEMQNVPEFSKQTTTFVDKDFTQLRKQGVVIVEKGETLRFILPEDTFFKPGNSALRPGRQETVGMIAMILQNYAGAPIRVIGYTDQVGDRHYQKSLSTEYARVIAAYLWNMGIDVDSVKGKGMGHSVSSNQHSDGAADNRRVEILVN